MPHTTTALATEQRIDDEPGAMKLRKPTSGVRLSPELSEVWQLATACRREVSRIFGRDDAAAAAAL